ncbi:MAG: hypothetical protein AB7O28_05950 [Vicinamibacterales bacterium]
MANQQTRCPACGHGVIAGWMHCPECRGILPDTRLSAAAESEEAPWWWPALVAGTLAFGVGVWLLWPVSGAATPSTAPGRAPAAVVAPAPRSRPNRPAATVGDAGRAPGQALPRPGATAPALAENVAALPASALQR